MEELLVLHWSQNTLKVPVVLAQFRLFGLAQAVVAHRLVLNS